MKPRLLIIGAGGFGREVLNWSRDAQRAQNEWAIGGFLDSNFEALDGFDARAPIVGDPRDFQPSPWDVFICAIGDPGTRLRVCRDLEARGAKFASVVHPTAIVGADCRIGRGAVICPYVAVTANVTIGEFAAINVHASVGHDAVVGPGSVLNGHADVTGGAVLGEGVFLGSHAVVMPGANVGDFARVGAGSVVLRKVKPHTTVIGVPAKAVCTAGDLSIRRAA